MDKNYPPAFPQQQPEHSHSRSHSYSSQSQKHKRQSSNAGDSSANPALPPAPAMEQVEESLLTFKWIEAIRSSDLPGISSLLQQQQQSGFSHFSFGSPLHLAAAFATKQIVEHLLKSLVTDGSTSGKNLSITNLIDKNGNTCLHVASKAGRISICELLLKNGADCTITNNDGRDASEVAKTQKVVDLIISYRKTFSIAKAREMLAFANSGNMTAIQNMFNNSRVAKLVNINQQDPMTGDTLLHIACEQNNFDMVAWSLKMRSDPLLRDKKGRLAVERTKNEKIKSILKGALSQPSFSASHHGQSTNATGGVRMQGVLYKWTNYAGGYKKRWFVLEDGVLSYYRSQEDVPVSCRGSISLQVAKLWIDGSDRNRFDVVGRGNIRYHLRADQAMEAKRWVIALTEAKQWLQDNEEFRNRVEKNLQMRQQANSNLTPSNASDSPAILPLDSDTERDAISESSTVDFKLITSDSLVTMSQNEDEDVSASYEETFHANINAAMAAVHSQRQLIQTLLSFIQPASSQNSSYSQIVETLKKACHSLSLTLNELLRLNNDRERFWEHRIEREEALKRVWEDNLRSLAAEHDALQEKAADEVNNLKDKAKNLSFAAGEISDEEDEFFDVESPEQNSALVVPVTPGGLISNSIKGYPAEQPEGFRKSLPLSSADRVELSLWSVLKNNIGRDLSKIALPVFFNEPLSMLQRLCEDLEYSNLLDVAASRESSLERTQFVAAFAMSNYSSTEGRVGKPFNPLLGETFEYVRKDRGYRYISEQVSHDPPISACFCESENYIFNAEAHLKNRFWGKSLEVFPQGTCHLFLKKTEEHYSWKKVTTAINNLIVGKLWIDHYGDMVVTNHQTGEVCTLTFKPAGWRGKSQYEIEGRTKSSDGSVKYEISGHWNDKIVSKCLETGENILLWKRHSILENASKNYNFTEFAITLNELSNDMEKWICKTDSRMRPDQKAMERGEYELADREKIRLETNQRTRRHERKNTGVIWTPKWFIRDVDKDSGEEHWSYRGGYWESRTNNWQNVEVIDIFD